MNPTVHRFWFQWREIPTLPYLRYFSFSTSPQNCGWTGREPVAQRSGRFDDRGAVGSLLEVAVLPVLLAVGRLEVVVRVVGSHTLKATAQLT